MQVSYANARSMTLSPPPVQLINNADGSVSLISGKTRFTVKTPKQENYRDRLPEERQQTRGEAKCKEETMKISSKGQSVFTCCNCDKEFLIRFELIRHREACVGIGQRSSKQVLDNATNRCLERSMKQSPERSAPPPARRNLMVRTRSKEKFTSLLNLIPVTKVKDIEKKNVQKILEIDEIDLTDDVDVLPPKSPRNPSTPRTLKSLLSFDSQMSKMDDESSCSDNSSSERETHTHSNHYAMPTNKTLLSIPLSSTLGLRLKQHMEGAVEKGHTNTRYEQFCRTPVKNRFSEKLRTRDMVYPVTFRKNRHHKLDNHLYKFTSKQRRDFMKKMTIDLNKNSRQLLRSLDKCEVRLKKLNKCEVKRLSKVRSAVKFHAFSVNEMSSFQQSPPRPHIFCRGPKFAQKGSANDDFSLQQLLGQRLAAGHQPLCYIPKPFVPSTARPVGLFSNCHNPAQHHSFNPVFNRNIFSDTRALFNNKRAIAHIAPMVKPTNNISQMKVPIIPVRPLMRSPLTSPSLGNANKMIEKKIDDDISIVLPMDECIILSSDDDSPKNRQQQQKPPVPPTRVPRLEMSTNKSYSTALTNLPSPAKRVISAAHQNVSDNEKTFLFRCHLCGLEERHLVSQSKDIYKHLHSNHRGEIIHIVDYKLHGEVHLVEAMSKPPTVMKTAPEVAKCRDSPKTRESVPIQNGEKYRNISKSPKTKMSSSSSSTLVPGKRSARIAMSTKISPNLKPKPSDVICIDD